MNTLVLSRPPEKPPVAYVAEACHVKTFMTERDIPNEAGFIMAPYTFGAQTPGIFVSASAARSWESFERDFAGRSVTLDAMDPDDPVFSSSDEVRRARYDAAFHACHEALARGELAKVVLARTQGKSVSQALDLVSLFEKACQKYPTAYVCAVMHPQAGAWLICSPERLLVTEGLTLKTMSLAGTMRVPMGEPIPAWSDKNRHEQQVVTDYLVETLKPWTAQCHLEGPMTVRAGELVHLATFVTVTLSSPDYKGLLTALHPTPALCGLPKREAQALLARAEGWDRTYYSGYFGEWSPQGVTLFVNLRSAKLYRDGIQTFAGGGLLVQSDVQSEWQETQAKMNTILSLLD